MAVVKSDRWIPEAGEWLATLVGRSCLNKDLDLTSRVAFVWFRPIA